MDTGIDFGWMSLLQKRTDYVRKMVTTARTPEIAKEFEELAELYQTLMDGQTPMLAKYFLQMEPKIALLHHLQARASQLLADAREIADKGWADDLRYLAGVYGAEAARFKNGGVR